MERAILDGVDIISMSLGGGTGPYKRDPISIASFKATQHGTLVSSAAGNDGPKRCTVHHVAPWDLSVGASSVDREFSADVVLGDNRTFPGASFYAGRHVPLFDRRYKLVYGGDFGNRYCKIGGFSNEDELTGEFVVCDQGSYSTSDMAAAVDKVFGRGEIIANKEGYGEELEAEPYFQLATRVGKKAGEEIKKYIQSSQNPTANILLCETVINGSTSPPAPQVASFSSRGPNPVTPQILKPDVITPGLNILAAWTDAAGPLGEHDWRRVEFNIISGTSMACPHVSGIAALIKKVHPSWSPAAIKSAFMTTAYYLDNSGEKLKDLWTGFASTPFVHGSGHVDPNRAADPNLIYDLDTTDYVGFFCSLGYTRSDISRMLGKKVDSTICEDAYAALGGKVTPGDLNLPSFSVRFKKEAETQKFRRSVTNVGSNIVDAVYSVTAGAQKGIKITVSPKQFVFNANNQTQTLEVKI